MKKYEIRIVIEVENDVRRDQIQVLDHDVCDGLEVLLTHPNNTEEFKLKSYALIDVIELQGTTNEDIQEVAKRMGLLKLSESQLNWVRLSYQDAQRQDPTASWNLVVEDLLYMLKNNFEG
jgi:hypothetical protein